MYLPDYMEREHARWAEEEKALKEFEDRALLHEDPGADCFDRTPSKREREIELMEAEDTSSYDLDGLVFP